MEMVQRKPEAESQSVHTEAAINASGIIDLSSRRC